MPESFQQRFVVQWGDLDTNGHMRNVAYLEYATQTRFAYLTANGIFPEQVKHLRSGPVVLREELSYVAELFVWQEISVSLSVTEIGPDHSHFRLLDEIRKANNELAAQVRVEGAWMNLARRRLAPPLEELRLLFERLLAS